MMQLRPASKLIRASTLPVISARSVKGFAARRTPQIARYLTYQVPKVQSPLKLEARCFSTSFTNDCPSSQESQPLAAEKSHTAPTIANITPEKYHKLSNQYMDVIVEKLEDIQEERADVDVDYISGVLTLVFPPAGTYVINKQPPNKQIWLSSPISGPKRYDYVYMSESDSVTGSTDAGEWVYMRDGSMLKDLLEEELGVILETSNKS